MDNPEQIDLAMLKDSGWFPGSVEVHSGAGTGSGLSAYDMRTPLGDLLAREAAEEDPMGTDDEYLREERKRWMTQGAFLIIREAIVAGRSLDVVDIGLNIVTWAWDIQLPPFDRMSQEQIGELVAQGRAAICERHKIKAERKKEAVGMTATKTQKQKPGSLIDRYRKSAEGNRNRARAGMEEALEGLG